MPELPEVQTIVDDLRALLLGRRISRVQVEWPGSIAMPSWQTFCQMVCHVRITALRRRGKFIILSLANERVIVIHLRMTGGLKVVDSLAESAKHPRVIFHLDDERLLIFSDMRKFGRIYLVGRDELDAFFSGLGVEPLEADFTPPALEGVLAKRRGKLKGALLDQRGVAGLGNIYVDEALFAARLHPERAANSLDAGEVARLHAAIQAVLMQSLRYRGTSMRDYVDGRGREGLNKQHLAVYHRTGEPCLHCGTPIERRVVAGRGTHLCPHCQDETKNGDAAPPTGPGQAAEGRPGAEE